MKRILFISLVFISAALGLNAQGADNPAPSASASSGTFDITKIQHVVVIYQENWSYDGLYGSFPNSNGFAFGQPVAQTDIAGQPLATQPQAINNEVVPPVLDGRFPGTQAVMLYNMSPMVPASTTTGDIVHKFYTEQLQIDGGKMDRFVAWTDNPGMVLGGFDATNLPEGKLAQEFVMCDNAFHSAFGGSFLNHQFFISAQAPVWPDALTAAKATDLLAGAGAPASVTQAKVEAPPAGSNLLPKPKASMDTATLSFPSGNNWPPPLAKSTVKFDNHLTVGPIEKDGKDYYAVNTVQPSNWPFDVKGPFLPLQTHKTIGDLLTDKSVSWKWYSGGWDQAVAGPPAGDFQYHHQPFNYYANYAPGTPGRAHLVDVKQFATDLAANNLPAVAFVKFEGELTEHPGYADIASGQQATADLVKQIQDSSAWPTTLIIITYDENGGRWDHVAPPKIDEWGPGTRVPMILISPFVKRHFVDHTQYETVSILRFIEDRWQLPALATRDKNANSFTNAFADAVNLSK